MESSNYPNGFGTTVALAGSSSWVFFTERFRCFQMSLTILVNVCNLSVSVLKIRKSNKETIYNIRHHPCSWKTKIGLRNVALTYKLFGDTSVFEEFKKEDDDHFFTYVQNKDELLVKSVYGHPPNYSEIAGKFIL